MKAGKKIQKKFETRGHNFMATVFGTVSDSKVEQRKETGGYRKPGSRKK